jgi:hypothetical protein
LDPCAGVEKGTFDFVAGLGRTVNDEGGVVLEHSKERQLLVDQGVLKGCWSLLFVFVFHVRVAGVFTQLSDLGLKRVEMRPIWAVSMITLFPVNLSFFVHSIELLKGHIVSWNRVSKEDEILKWLCEDEYAYSLYSWAKQKPTRPHLPCSIKPDHQKERWLGRLNWVKGVNALMKPDKAQEPREEQVPKVRVSCFSTNGLSEEDRVLLEKRNAARPSMFNFDIPLLRITSHAIETKLTFVPFDILEFKGITLIENEIHQREWRLRHWFLAVYHLEAENTLETKENVEEQNWEELAGGGVAVGPDQAEHPEGEEGGKEEQDYQVRAVLGEDSLDYHFKRFPHEDPVSPPVVEKRLGCFL